MNEDDRRRQMMGMGGMMGLPTVSHGPMYPPPMMYGMGSTMKTHPVHTYTQILTQNAWGRDIYIPTTRLCVLFAYQDIEDSATPEEKNIRLSMNSKFVLALLHGVIYKKTKNDDHPDRKALQELDRQVISCELTSVGCKMESYSEVSRVARFTYRMGTYKRRGADDEGGVGLTKDGSDIIEVPIDQMGLGERMAVNNALKRINCQAEHIFYEIMKLAAKYDLIDPEFGIDITDEGITAEAVMAQQQRLAKSK